MKTEEFFLTGAYPTSRRAVAAGWIVCPALSGWPAAQAEYLAHLPVRDANDAALRALAKARSTRAAHVAIFAGDPFIHLPTVFRAAARAGVEALAAYPTAQMFDGETARVIASAGYGLSADAAFVRAARAAGFETLAFAFDLTAARTLLDAGATHVVLHPGPEARDQRGRRAALAAVDATRAALGDAPILIHRAYGYDPATLDALAARARGAVHLHPSMP